MKKTTILALAIAAALPFTMLGACTSDDNGQTDSGPQNHPDTGTDSPVTQDTGTQDTSTTNDAGVDAPNACATGLVYDNTGVPGWPTNVPTP